MILRATIIPCIRLPRHLGFFDYIYDTELFDVMVPGMFVEVPFRNKTILGVVVNATPDGITDKLKTVATTRPDMSPLPLEEIEYIVQTAQWYCVSPATILRINHPSTVTKLSKRKNKHPIAPSQKTKKQLSFVNIVHPTLFHYNFEQDCINFYRSLIKTNLKNKKQLIIVTPNEVRTQYLASCLSEKNPIAVFHSEDGVKATKIIREGASSGSLPVIIGTRQLISIPYENLGTIVVDQSEHRNHKLHEGSPLIDTCISAYHKAHAYNANLVYASCAPRLEEYSYISCTHPTAPTSFSPTIVSLHDEFRGGNTTHISDSLQEEIISCLERKKDVILSLNHTGMSKYIVCKGCKTTITCPTCDEPLRYTLKGQTLSCPTCTYTQLPPDQCPVCQGVHFAFPGLGIEKIAQQLSIIHPNTPIITVDAKNPTIPPPANTPIIIIGTSYVSNHYPERIAAAGLIGLITVDPIISMEQYRSVEQQWQEHASFLSLLSDNAKCVIQAFNTEHPFVQSLISLNYHGFADNELTLRTQHNLPPARRHIVCIYKGYTDQEQSEVPRLINALKEIIPTPSTIDISQKLPIVTVIPKSLNRPYIQVLIRLPDPYNPDQTIPELIHATLMKCSVDWMIDPDPRIL